MNTTNTSNTQDPADTAKTTTSLGAAKITESTPRVATASSAPKSPRLSTKWWGLLIRAVAAFGMLMLATTAVGVIVQPLAMQLETNSVPQGLIVLAGHIVVFAAIVFMVWGWMRLVERKPLSAAGWRGGWSSIGWLGAGTLASIVVMAVATLVVTLVLPTPAVEALPEANAGVAPTPIWLLIAIVITKSYLLQGIPEELLYRGWLFSVTRDRPWLTMVWTSLAFTVIHLISSGGQETVLDHILYLAVPLGFGAFAGALVLLTGSMWVAAGVHGGLHIASAIIMVLFPVPVQSGELVIVGAVYLVFTAIVLMIWQQRSHKQSVRG
ncbi:MAG: lysostaphin resistance A-like protein [Gulosibacter sp.]|uniref:CPBP family intramembrane glutamic endopeptidase n=1 Tax=Gulosibacter sp. TaxID=2817531 RepID=UPI003F8FE988